MSTASGSTDPLPALIPCDAASTPTRPFGVDGGFHKDGPQPGTQDGLGAELIRILPGTTIRRAYWTTYHESARDLVRVRTVADFLQELVTEEHGIFI